MNFKEMMERAGALVREIGHEILIAAENEDISALRPLAKRLQEIMDLLNVITLCDKMAGAAPDN